MGEPAFGKLETADIAIAKPQPRQAAKSGYSAAKRSGERVSTVTSHATPLGPRMSEKGQQPATEKPGPPVTKIDAPLSAASAG